MKYKKMMAALVGCIVSATASASLVFTSTIQLSAQGFGTAPRNLTIQETGPNRDGTESGCVGVGAGGSITFNTCVSDLLVFDRNGITNQSFDLVTPLADNQKFGITSSLGITNANQIGILFNATEPGQDSVNVTDLTLKFFSATGMFLGAIDGSQNFPSSFAGNGSAGFVFTVSLDEQAFVNGLLATPGGTLLALESTITDAAAGPESFLLINLARPGGPGTAIPEPAGIALFGIALLGGLAASRKRLVRDQKAI